MKKPHALMEDMVPFHVHSEFLENLAYLSISLIILFLVIETVFVFNRAYVNFFNARDEESY